MRELDADVHPLWTCVLLFSTLFPVLTTGTQNISCDAFSVCVYTGSAVSLPDSVDVQTCSVTLSSVALTAPTLTLAFAFAETYGSLTLQSIIGTIRTLDSLSVQLLVKNTSQISNLMVFSYDSVNLYISSKPSIDLSPDSSCVTTPANLENGVLTISILPDSCSPPTSLYTYVGIGLGILTVIIIVWVVVRYFRRRDVWSGKSFEKKLQTASASSRASTAGAGDQ